MHVKYMGDIEVYGTFKLHEVKLYAQTTTTIHKLMLLNTGNLCLNNKYIVSQYLTLIDNIFSWFDSISNKTSNVFWEGPAS